MSRSSAKCFSSFKPSNFYRSYSNHPSPPPSSPLLRILAIESSCDDSCASIVSSDKKIHSNIFLSQAHIHAPYHGIHPYHAINAHQLNIVSSWVLHELLSGHHSPLIQTFQLLTTSPSRSVKRSERQPFHFTN